MTAPTNDRQTSEREMLADDLERFGHSSTDCDSAVWQAVAQLRADEAEIAQARAAYERAENDVQILTREIAALRAENEALRTVTPDDVEGFLTALAEQGCRGVEYIHYAEILTALQSFIRSKESRRE